MSKLKSVAVAVAFLALAMLVVWQEVRTRRLMAELAALRNQLGQAAAVREESERLAGQLQSATERARADSSELGRLRGQAARSRQIERENVQLKSERDRPAKRAQSPDTQESADDLTPEAKLQRAKGFFGRDLGLALRLAADANGGVVPTELRGPLFQVLERLSAGEAYDIEVSQFELVFTGSLDDVPYGEERILAREKEPVQRADGQWVRLYVMADGSSRYVSAASRDAFAAREKEFWPQQFKQ